MRSMSPSLTGSIGLCRNRAAIAKVLNFLRGVPVACQQFRSVLAETGRGVRIGTRCAAEVNRPRKAAVMAHGGVFQSGNQALRENLRMIEHVLDRPDCPAGHALAEQFLPLNRRAGTQGAA